MYRSCRARLAKRRSGTRAQLLKKGCGSKGTGSPDHGLSSCTAPTTSTDTAAAAAAAAAHMENQALIAEQQLLAMYGCQSGEPLQGLFSDASTDAAAAAATAAAEAGVMLGSPQQHATPAMSDGAPMAAAAAATTAAAATNAAAAAADHALSAPLYMLNHMGYTGGRQQAALTAAAAAAAAAEDQMNQAEVLLALQAVEDKSDTLLRVHGSGSSSSAPGEAAAVAPGAALTPRAPPPAAAVASLPEHTTCSIPLAQLDLGHSMGAPLGAPCSPTNSMGGAACKSAPLAGFQHADGLLQAMGLSGQRSLSTATAAALRHQGSSRMKWLIQQLQQELEACNPAELESLNNEELGTLLCVALAPPAAATAAGAMPGGSNIPPAAAQTQSGPAAAAGLQDPANAPWRGASGSCPLGLMAGFRPDLSAQHGSQMPTELQVQFQHAQAQAQVQDLQQKVEQLQLQLNMQRDAQQRDTIHSAIPSSAAPAAAAAPCTDPAALYRSVSSVADAKAANRGPMQLLDPARVFTSGSMTAPLPMMNLPGPAAAGLMQHRPCTPVPAAASMGAPAGWVPGMSNGTATGVLKQQQQLMPQSSVAQQLMPQSSVAQQLMPQSSVAQQMMMRSLSPQMGVSGAMTDSAAAQYMALQKQLMIAEEEMLRLLARQATAAR